MVLEKYGVESAKWVLLVSHGHYRLVFTESNNHLVALMHFHEWTFAWT